MKRVSLDEMIAHLEAAPARVLAARAAGLAAAGAIVTDEAKAMLGHYQLGGGDMPDWAGLQESTKEIREQLGFTPDDPELRTARLRAAIEPHVDAGDGVLLVGVASKFVGDGTRADPIRDIGKVALAQEMGTNKLPRRSFLGLAMFRRAHDAVNLTARAVALAIAGR